MDAEHVLRFPVVCDEAYSELDLALAERTLLVEKCAELLHHAQKFGAIQPNLVRRKKPSPSLQQRIYPGTLFRRVLIGRDFKNAARELLVIHSVLSPWSPQGSFQVDGLKLPRVHLI